MIVMLLILSLASVGVNLASGMGPPASACNNRYMGTFTASSVTLANGTGIDVLNHPNSTIVMPNIDAYNVTFTMHLAPESVNYNTEPGDRWGRTR